MRLQLGVNIDHVATLRQQRNTGSPDPIDAAFAAERAGADQITVHLREDRRHIQVRDLKILRETIRTRLNLEMAVTEPMFQIATDIGVDQVTLVPERDEEQTTEGGLDLLTAPDRNQKFIQRLQDAGIAVSIFVDPERKQLQAARDQGATSVELHTGDFSYATDDDARQREFERIKTAAQTAASLDLNVAAGHGLNHHTVHWIKTIAEIEELNIGHSLVARAVITGFERSVRELIEAMRRD